MTDEHIKTIIRKGYAINLKCFHFLNRACDPNVQYVTYINTATHHMIVANKKWNNVLPIGKNGDAKKEIHSLFPELFHGICCVKTTYKIELNQDAVPVRHTPRRVPEAVKSRVTIELERLVSEGKILPIVCPTDWVNRIVTTTKTDGSIHMCLDPSNSNKYISRPHYYSPTIYDILPDLQGSKFYSALDARSGYWNIQLCEKSQLLTTLNTPGFGRFFFWLRV